jgi:hypothetical protein
MKRGSMITKYRTWYDGKIEKVEIERETAKFVIFQDGKRYAKMTDDFYCFFDTFTEAKEHLISKVNTEIFNHMNKVNRLKDWVKKIEAIQEHPILKEATP